jgi:hypothetical protein
MLAGSRGFLISLAQATQGVPHPSRTFAKGGNRKCPHDRTNTYRIAISTIFFEFLLPAIVSRYQLRTEVTPEIGAELVKTHKSILSCHPERSRMIREASRSVESKDPYFSPRSPVASAFDSHK